MPLRLVLLEFLLKRIEVVTIGASGVLNEGKGDRFMLNAVHPLRIPTEQRVHKE